MMCAHGTVHRLPAFKMSKNTLGSRQCQSVKRLIPGYAGKTETAPGLSLNSLMPSTGTLWLAEAQPHATSLTVCPGLPQARSTSQSSARSCASSSPCMEVLCTTVIVLVVHLWPFSLSPSDFSRERERCWPKPKAPFQERKYHYTGIMNERDPSAVFKAKHEPGVHLGSVLSRAPGFL